MHNSATIINIAERNATLFSRAPANENEAGFSDMFRKQCEVEKILREQDMIDAGIEAKNRKLIQKLIECGRG